ncbi:tetraacyldisaccharide 4'-kinase [Candidatus Phycorickettsia trachydisci]|uniref:Tetraacyldisaccharide 4'-kinase n=1 Tax=Candidatus Phycorickettsia trachydisci TaxID=2115978 RepID=A0A2P1P967_9RICK|nr:tetraacyldisaccharide 4'-kinase [Candidatus Phycorickettsia trachydisci]AVP87818.1 tetraacyldisaccharide 4'-kinase [Candidatus Phycorickettsia trachydisci]
MYPKFWNSKSIISTLLLPLTHIYVWFSERRKRLANPIHFGIKTICVGNITVGGTGKTQFVMWLVQRLKNIKTVIVSKGYKSNFIDPQIVGKYDSPELVGDEPKLMSKITDVIVAKNPADASDLVAQINPDLVILDDFMQNPYVTKDFNILIIDADRNFGNNRLLPAGPLRQTFESAKNQIGLIIAIGSSPQRPNNLLDGAFYAQITSESELDTNKKYLAFAGVGNPERFFSCISHLNIVRKVTYSDHHNYLSQELYSLQKAADKLGATLLTTPKDAVKLVNKLKFEVFEPKLQFENPTDEEKILSILSQ